MSELVSKDKEFSDFIMRSQIGLMRLYLQCTRLVKEVDKLMPEDKSEALENKEAGRMFAQLSQLIKEQMEAGEQMLGRLKCSPDQEAPKHE